MRIDPSQLEGASERLRNNKTLGLAACGEKMGMLHLVGEDLKDDKDFVLACVRGSPPSMYKSLDYLMCYYVSGRLRSDREFVKKLLRLTSSTQHLPSELEKKLVRSTIQHYS